MVNGGFADFLQSLLGGLSGRVSSEVSSDVQLVVRMGECTQIFWIRFGGAGRVPSEVSSDVQLSVRRFFGFVLVGNRFQSNDATFLLCMLYFVFACFIK